MASERRERGFVKGWMYINEQQACTFVYIRTCHDAKSHPGCLHLVEDVINRSKGINEESSNLLFRLEIAKFALYCF